MNTRIPISFDEISKRVKAYGADKVEVTSELYAFGEMLLRATFEQTNQIEGKAVTLAGYSGAILAFLVVGLPSWPAAMHGWERSVLAIAATLALVAGAASLSAVFVRKHGWFTDSQWFQSEEGLLENADLLKRYHVLAMCSITQEHGPMRERKAICVLVAQIALSGCMVCLAAVLGSYLLACR